jgi:CCR4-NOT transcription complex subunit 9
MEETNSKDISSEEGKEVLNNNNDKNSNEVEKIIEWVNQIRDESTREGALAELSRKRESFSDLALYIWYTSGVVSCLLQEIINTYQLLAPPVLNIQSSNRACNVLALFQCVAAHPETRPAFLTGNFNYYLLYFFWYVMLNYS